MLIELKDINASLLTHKCQNHTFLLFNYDKTINWVDVKSYLLT